MAGFVQTLHHLSAGIFLLLTCFIVVYHQKATVENHTPTRTRNCLNEKSKKEKESALHNECDARIVTEVAVNVLKKPVLSVDFKGGIGNQLFMYASLMGLAETHGFEAKIPPNLPLLNSFELSLSTLNDTWEKENPLMLYERAAAKYDNKLVKKLKASSANNKDAIVYGYLQSYKYFSHTRDKILKEFSMKETLLSQINNKSEDIKRKHGTNKTYVAVHVRRGDFLKYSEFGYRTGDMSYFQKAMAQFDMKNVVFLILSDDIYWCKANFPSHLHKEFVETNNAIIDLGIMTQCDHVIYDTGTYGWWGAWLAGGKVIYMKQFATKGSKLEKEIQNVDHFLPSWIGM